MHADGQASPTAAAVELPELGWDEIRRHDTRGDCWVVFDGFVYDVSDWMSRHPGGADILLANHGHDATEAFASIGHSAHALATTEGFRIGRLRADENAAAPERADGDGGLLEIPYAVR